MSIAVFIYTVRQKKGTNFLLCAPLLILDRNWRFFSHILRNMKSTISVYLNLACVKNLG